MKRQLAAIMFTDIVGYSALMQQDEHKGIALRKRHRSVFNALTAKYGGKILHYYGDGTLSIFNSAVEAVECAVEMQTAFQQAPCVPLRIGIHTGDIAYDEEEVFGDGLNVASRIESVGIEGGIIISGKVFDDIKNHEWLRAESIGYFHFKGISENIELLAVTSKGLPKPASEQIGAMHASAAKVLSILPAQPKTSALSWSAFGRVGFLSFAVLSILIIGILSTALILNKGLQININRMPDGTTSIAVLPFSNMSTEEENEYFSDGITEDILTLLSQIEGFRVVSRTSVMQYKDTEKDIRQIGKELHADHILEGSVRREGNKVRVVAQLIDARTDKHIWAETYDREITEIFNVQSQVARDIAEKLQKKLTPTERAKINKKPTENVTAYDYYLRGRNYYTRYTPMDNDRAIQLFEKALETDPNFALAHAGLGDALGQKAYRYGHDPSLLDSALIASKKAIRLDPNLSEGFKSLGLVFQYQGHLDKALEAYLKAVNLNPNNDMAATNISTIFLGKSDLVEAIRWSKRSLDINPQYPWTVLNLAKMYLMIGEDEKCGKLVDQGLELHPDFAPFHDLKGMLYFRKKEVGKAKEQAELLTTLEPDNMAGYEMKVHCLLLEDQYDLARNQCELSLEKFSDEEDWMQRVGCEVLLAFIDSRSGLETDAQRQADLLLEKLMPKVESADYKGHYLSIIAMLYTIKGEKEKALSVLQKAVDHNWLDYPFVAYHPVFDSLRNEPGFQLLLRKMRSKISTLKDQVNQLEGGELSL